MALVVLVGLPCSGKSERAKEINDYLVQERGKSVFIASEEELIKNEGSTKNSLYSDPKKEIQLRAALLSLIHRNIGKYDVIIVDAMNYIGGFRYEVYCLTKSQKMTQCTVECITSLAEMRDRNVGRGDGATYEEEVFQSLLLRYEAPNDRVRWDSPLFQVLSDDDLRLEPLYNSLFARKAAAPNKSTVSIPESELYKTDKITMDVIKAILDMSSNHLEQGNVELSVYGGLKLNNIPKNITPTQLTRYKRQFLNYTKLHPPAKGSASPESVAALFVTFLNSHFAPTSS